MKIVFMAPFGIRPKGTLIARMLPLAVELQSLGHGITIVTPPYTNPEDSGKTKIVRGVKLVNVALPSAGKAMGAPIIAWRLLRSAQAEKPDLIHLFKPKGYGGLAAMLLIFCCRIGLPMPPLFLDMDDWEGKGGMNELHDYSAVEKRLYDFQERWLPERMRGVTVASRMLEELVLSMGINKKSLLYLPNCVEDSRAGDGKRVRKQLGIPIEAPVLLLYTRFFEFEQEKVHSIFAKIKRQVPEVCFLVVGKGRHGEEERLAAAALDMGFQKALFMAGWVEPDELPDFLAAGDVAIYPYADTLVNRAKCPAKLTELLRAGIPVVADRIGQIPEYLAPELHAFLCDADNWGEMAEKCVELLVDTEQRKRASSAVRMVIIEKFAWRDYAKKLNDFYTGCLSAG